ncbi:MAG: hypothetical protein NTX06_01830 [Proteobacteria bacterium]|nr:hypothetical protein [Pseudomonadota bacterium]
MIARMIQILKDRPGQLKKCFFGCLAVVAAADIFIARHEPSFWGDTVPLFWAVFGFCCCLAMAIVCKWVSEKLLARDENYYDL